jgi:2-oxoglutarate ferredoxin oxidoreductase subunit beta
MGETIHAANRNENITIFFVNNAVYGMTGGQMAPTTLPGQKTVTTPCGRSAAEGSGQPIRMCELLNTLDGPYHIERVALSGAQGVIKTRRAIRTAFEAQMANKGYTFIEVLSPCPIHQHLEPAAAIKFVGEEMTRYFPLGVFRKEGVPVHA